MEDFFRKLIKQNISFLYELYIRITMLEFETKIKKWGNSLGIVIPKEKFNGETLKENDSLIIFAMKKNDAAKKTFGILKDWKITGQEAKDRARRELYYDR